jgi:hypothetical protein
LRGELLRDKPPDFNQIVDSKEIHALFSRQFHELLNTKKTGTRLTAHPGFKFPNPIFNSNRFPCGSNPADLSPQYHSSQPARPR